jgi:exosortase A-associated hydrolase 2
LPTEAFFLQVSGSGRFCLLHLPSGSPRGAIVCIHPFAEEMNRSRRVAAQQARAFATAGYAVLQMDLFGCGDSAGDFGEASWSQWLADGHAAVHYIQLRVNAPVCLWALRSGALLAAQVAGELTSAVDLLLWQPVLSGNLHLQQFLRLQLAADMLDGKRRGGSEVLRQSLESGVPVEIAGYTIAPDLGLGMAAAELKPVSKVRNIVCLEIGNQTLSPALAKLQQAWPELRTSVVDDAQCWLNPDVAECPALIAASLQAVQGMQP